MAVQLSAGIANASLRGISAMVIKHVLPSKGAVVLVAQPLSIHSTSIRLPVSSMHEVTH
ncbi:MAG: hypothetical protein ACJA0V_004334 [Planctomycetota bacterium]|jgi:hypothetical protein